MKRAASIAMNRADSQRGFTLIELLTCVGIIAVLVALVTPAVSHSWRIAKATRCLSNLHQISSGYVPVGAGYFADPSTALKCPSASGEFAMYQESFFCAYPLSKNRKPASIVFVVEPCLTSESMPATPGQLAEWIDVTRHGSSANYLFADGHAEPIAWTTIEKDFTASHNFIDPNATW